MQIEAIAVLSDNYAWLLRDDASQSCAVVDPSDAGPVLERIEQTGLQLRWMLTTHHHADHTGGIDRLAQAFAGAEVLCSRQDHRRTPRATKGLEDQEVVQVAGHQATCMLVPGHTRGAMAFYFPQQRAVFTGDTLFCAGCGRLFEGTAQDMFASLQRLSSLPEETQIYCGHEYTLKNLEFAARVDAENPAVKQRLAAANALRQQGKPTVPATLAEELQTNPFLRACNGTLQRGGETPLAVFTELRRQRDRF